jgi:MFS family permease
MTARTASRLAWSAWGLTMAFLGTGLALYAVTAPATLRNQQVSRPFDAGMALAFAAYASVGALIASRRRENPIGWLFLAAGALMCLRFAGREYGIAGLVDSPGSYPGAAYSAWADQALTPAVLGSLALALLLFPTGRLHSRRWRPVFWAAVGFAALGLVGGAVITGPVDDFTTVKNPFGVHWLATALGEGAAFWLGMPLVFIAVLVCAAAAIVRYRRSRGEERQQLKWFVFAAAIVAVTFVPSAFWTPTVVDPFTVALLGLWVAIAVAIMKDRLYDIDRVVNRALVYGLLTVVLAGVYVGLAVGLGSVVGKDNPLVIAGSTLVVAALFRPVRGWVQGLIDRRFYRRKYDAVRTIEVFTAPLRHEVDLQQLRAHLLAAVGETMQPSHASLWLREAPR